MLSRKELFLSVSPFERGRCRANCRVTVENRIRETSDPRPSAPGMRFFLAGIMQGSQPGPRYTIRITARIKSLLVEHIPGPGLRSAGRPCELARVPRPAWGEKCSFITISSRPRSMCCWPSCPRPRWEPPSKCGRAYGAGRTVITISPLVFNWTVRFLSHEIYATVEAFEELSSRPPSPGDCTRFLPSATTLLADRDYPRLFCADKNIWKGRHAYDGFTHHTSVAMSHMPNGLPLSSGLMIPL